MIIHSTPADIERTSLGIIASELEAMSVVLPEENEAVVKRVIHATADFEYASSLRFTDGACRSALEAIAGGTVIVTDTNMAKAGISRAALDKLKSRAVCYMAEAQIADLARAENTTRAVISMRKAAEEYPDGIFAVGNAPTALFELCRLINQGFRPSLIIAVPVGFVNVIEAKEQIFACCTQNAVPCIAAMGRKGGSTIAAAICNALLYSAADYTDPSKRGWH